ncbi:hypothetical protein Droror1_Dr00021331 [Drosera rotundifolia]
MQLELDSLLLKFGEQSKELSEKQKELGRLWTSVQEERLRLAEAETAFQALENLHSQTQEELRSVATDLQKQVQLFKDMEARNQQLSSEIENIKKENKSLSEVSISSTLSIKTMQFLCSPMDVDVAKVVPLQFPDKGKAKMDEVDVAESVNDEHVVEEVEKSAKEEEPEEEDLRKVFEKVGDVEVRLLNDPVTEKNRGFAFVRFATMDAKESDSWRDHHEVASEVGYHTGSALESSRHEKVSCQRVGRFAGRTGMQ